MVDRPILFSAPMVRAILAGTKTQTRRIVKWRGIDAGLNLQFSGLRAVRDRGGLWALESDTRTSRETRCDLTVCPYGQPGDRLWVRESHWFFQDEHDPVTGYTPPVLTTDDVEYRADGESTRHGWRPSIHMPRWASRITLSLTGVRVERLQEISEADATAEGTTNSLHLGGGRFATENFAHLWGSINGHESWEANPWVWVVEFEHAKA
jgi:hypothetical protein